MKISSGKGKFIQLFMLIQKMEEKNENYRWTSEIQGKLMSGHVIMLVLLQ